MTQALLAMDEWCKLGNIRKPFVQQTKPYLQNKGQAFLVAKGATHIA